MDLGQDKKGSGVKHDPYYSKSAVINPLSEAYRLKNCCNLFCTGSNVKLLSGELTTTITDIYPKYVVSIGELLTIPL